MRIRHRHDRGTRVWKHSPFARKRSELEEKVDDFGWPPFETHGAWESAAWAPDVDLFVKNNHLVARMDLPGLTKDDVSIEIGDGALTVRGTRLPGSNTGHLYRCACEHGTFFRTIPLPEGVAGEDVKVTFANDILEIAIAPGEGPVGKLLTGSHAANESPLPGDFPRPGWPGGVR